MSLSLNFNVASQQAVANLSTANTSLEASIRRLSSGVRISKASDDPAAMVQANALRHQITGISQAIQNCEEGVSMVQTADAGADGISTLLTTLRSLALDAANSGVNDAAQLAALQDEMNSAIDSINNTATGTTFGTIPLLQGGLGNDTLSTAAGTYYQNVAHDATLLPGGIAAGSTITVDPPVIGGSASSAQMQVSMGAGTPPATLLTSLVQNGVPLTAVPAGTAITITGPQGTAAIPLTITDTLASVLTAISTATPTTGVTATYDQTSGMVTLASTPTGSFAVSANQSMSAGTTALFAPTAGVPVAAYGANTQRGHLAVTLDGKPAGSTLLANLSQAGAAFTGTMPAGTQMTVTGPRGSATIPLNGTTTIDQFTAAVDAASASTGVTANYDTTTGVYSLDAEGPGAFAVSVNNAMEAGGSAFLDASAGTSTAQVLANPLVSATSDLRREGMTVVLATAGGAVPSGTTALQGLQQDGTTLSAVAGTLTIGGVTGSASVALSPTLSIDDLVARINALTGQTGVQAAYDADVGALTLQNTGFGSGVLTAKASQDMSGGGNVGLLDLNPAGTLDTFSMSFLNDYGQGNPAIPTAADVLQGLEVNGTAIDATAGKTFTIYGANGTQSTMALAGTVTGGGLAGWLDAFVNTPLPGTNINPASGALGWTPDGMGGGTLAFTPAAGAVVGGIPTVPPFSPSFAVTANTTAQQLAAFMNTLDTAGNVNPPSDLSLAVQNGVLTATYNDGVNPPSAAAAGFGGTTIQQVLDFINQNPTVKNLTATFDATTGKLSVTSAAGPFNIASQKITTAGADIGLLDLDTASIADAGGAKTVSTSANPLEGPRDEYRMSLVNDYGQTVPAMPTAADSIQGLTVAGAAINASDGKHFTIFGPDGTQDTLTFATPTASAVLAAWVAQQPVAPASGTLAWTADAAGGGTLAFTPAAGAVVGAVPTVPAFNPSLAVTSSTTAQQLAAFMNTLDKAGNVAPPSGLSLGVQNGQLSATYTDGVHTPTTASTAVGGTTIQQVLDFINQDAKVRNLQASYDATTGALSVTSTAGSFNLSSEKLTTAATDVGLLDLNTADVNDTGGTKISSAANATLQVQFTDAAGKAHTVLLTQDPGANGGLDFINLNAGPEMHPPFTGWQAGALRVSAKDTTTPGDFHASLTVATTAQTATRVSTAYVQSGPLATQRIGIDIPDMRAAALGYTALQAEVASTNATKPLEANQLLNLEDLKDLSALSAGNAQEALTIIDAAIAEVSSARGKLGAVQSNAIQTTTNILQVHYNNLSDSESLIRDTDFATESANYSKEQIIYQAATAMLAQANQLPQTVVDRLFAK